MIPEYQEPKGLHPDAPIFDDEWSRERREYDARAGSQILLDAILKAQGKDLPPPIRRKSLWTRDRLQMPACCPTCGAPREPSPIIAHIQATVAAYYDVPLAELKSARRSKIVAWPRQVAMYLARELTPKSLPDIGRRFDRDHTTVIHAIKAVEAKIARDLELEMDVEILRERLAG